MIIDFHTHCFKDEVAVKAVPLLAERSGVTPASDGTLSGLLSSMAQAGIDKSVVLPIATKPSQVVTINDWVMEIAGTKIIPFGTIHPDYPDWKKEIRRLAGAGICGIKFHPDYQEFYVNETKMLFIYEEIFSYDMTIIFHAGVDIGLPPPVHCTPDQLLTIINTFPGAKLVAAHMGGFKMWGEVEKTILGADIYLETSYTLFMTGKEKMKELIKGHGVDRVIFGTDFPWAEQKKELSEIKDLGFSEAEQEKITWKNAMKLLKVE